MFNVGRAKRDKDNVVIIRGVGGGADGHGQLIQTWPNDRGQQ